MSFVRKMLAKKQAVKQIEQKRRLRQLDSFAEVVEVRYTRRMLTQAMGAQFYSTDGVEKRKGHKDEGKHKLRRDFYQMVVVAVHYEAATTIRDKAKSDAEREFYDAQLRDLFKAIKEVWLRATYQHAVERFRTEGHILGKQFVEVEADWRKQKPEEAEAVDREVEAAHAIRVGPKKVKPGPKKVKP